MLLKAGKSYSHLMIATIINAVAVIIGAFLGLFFKSRISSEFKAIVMTSSGLITLVLGLGMAFEAPDTLASLFSLILGGFAGTALKIEDRVLSLGERLAPKKEGEDVSFGLGFLNSSLLFCSGAMSIVGSIDAGTVGNYDLILIKSVMDGFMAVVFAAAYGKGVFLSALTIIIYQGFFTLAGGFLSPVLGEGGIAIISAVGGYLLIMLALSLLEIKKIKTGNFLPSLVFAPILLYLFSYLPL